MQGDGELKDWLHQTGKDIGKMVGAHLKKAAKDKAVSYAQEQLGNGLADELGMAAKSVAKKSAAHALDRAGDVHDAASAKAAAKSVGNVAKQEGLSQLGNLADKYFGGAGTRDGEKNVLIVCDLKNGNVFNSPQLFFETELPSTQIVEVKILPRSLPLPFFFSTPSYPFLFASTPPCPPKLPFSAESRR